MIQDATGYRPEGLVLACGLGVLGLEPCGQEQDKVFVMSWPDTINDTQHEWLRRVVAAVEKDSNGRSKGEIYPEKNWPDPRYRGLKFGSIQGSVPGISW